MGAKALADRMGVTRQHVAYHIGELLKLGLIKDMQAGSIVIYHVTDFGRTVLQRIHSISIPQAKGQVDGALSQPIPPSATSSMVSHNRGVTLKRMMGLATLFAGLILLVCSFIMAYMDGRPSYVIGGIILFVIFMVVRAIVVRGLPYSGR